MDIGRRGPEGVCCASHRSRGPLGSVARLSACGRFQTLVPCRQVSYWVPVPLRRPARSATGTLPSSERLTRRRVWFRRLRCPNGAFSCRSRWSPVGCHGGCAGCGPCPRAGSSLTATPSPRVDRPRALHGVLVTDQSDQSRTVEPQGTSTRSLTRPSSDRASYCPAFARAACICQLAAIRVPEAGPSGAGPVASRADRNFVWHP